MSSHKMDFIRLGPHACFYSEEKKNHRVVLRCEHNGALSNENKVGESNESQP